jgi:hypothetical protein
MSMAVLPKIFERATYCSRESTNVRIMSQDKFAESKGSRRDHLFSIAWQAFVPNWSAFSSSLQNIVILFRWNQRVCRSLPFGFSALVDIEASLAKEYFPTPIHLLSASGKEVSELRPRSAIRLASATQSHMDWADAFR